MRKVRKEGILGLLAPERTVMLDLRRGHTEHSVRYVRYAWENSCLYGQHKGPHKTAYAMFAMLAM